jgi:hypothetical protein
MFSITSRYYGMATVTLETAAGKKIVFVRRRFVPPPENFDLLVEHVVTEGERVDSITGQYLGDPEQFWRVCDANGVVRPEELVEPIGRRIRITLPEGIPGTSDA